MTNEQDNGNAPPSSMDTSSYLNSEELFDNILSTMDDATFMKLLQRYGESFVDGISKNSTIKFTSDAKGYISIFALSGVAKGVTIKGLLYELNDAEITPSFPIGVSNEFLNKDSEISVSDGVLTIIFEGKENLIK
jgi:thiamine pyrophosphokinase